MGKTRVYELAQKLGLENKALLDRLEAAGVEGKTHMSVLEEDDIRKFEAASTPTVETTVEKIEEERITPGIIRRRRKEVAAPPVVESLPEETATAEAAPSEPATAPTAEAAKEAPVAAEQEDTPPAAAAPVAAEPVQPVEKTPTKRVDAGEPVVAKAVAEKPAAEKPAAEKPAAEKPAAEKPAAEKPAAAAEPRAEKATASRAKILGRVELHQQAPRGTETRPDNARPARGERQERPGTQRPERPASARPERPGAPRPDRPSRPGSAPTPSLPVAGEPFVAKEARGGKKKKKGKGADYSEAPAEAGRRRGRREVFEPDRDGGKLRRGKRPPKMQKKTEVTVSKAIKRIIRISDVITVGELAKRMGVKANDLIKELMRQGSMVTINHPLDFETAAILASEFNYEVENVAFDEETILEHDSLKTTDEKVEDLKPRPPVVTIMGHVDHGKTSLLDAIRTANVTAGEAGGITQHIGAYDVELDGKKITFLDTPGHEAFTAMRARGAKATDIVILVVAADDGVMPQTKEAINHSKAAGVPIIIAINKMDKPDANPERVKQELTEFELVPEEWGGETIFVEVSAKQKTNLDQLLEMILLQAEVMDLKANPDKRAKGVVVEARLDKGRGPVATVLVQEGTLKIGDPIVTGVHFGRVRTMTNDRGDRLEEAGPSIPVEVTGLTGVPDAGDSFHSVEDEKAARDVAQHRQQKLREAELAKSSKISLEQLYARIQQGDVKELKVIIKGDVQGSVEAVKDSLLKLSTEACRLVVIHTGVGGIIESDVSLASASDAIVLGFNVRPEPKAANLAEAEGVDIRLYNIIYDAVADIRDAMEGLLAPTLQEKYLGRVEVRETFSVSKVGTIAGCYVTDGKVLRGAQVRLLRDNVVVWQGKMSSLKRFKDDVREVATGYECGIGLENYNDLKVGDIIEAFEIESIKTTL
ncbi:translation initiation factor IF-2 [Desulfuromonas carbonis]|uniref:translation initiation factor IF-2 n=1 Tax=Desulfuromonas sp. DDH964 TaxID=1823759 RepID=UPI00078D8737|nr:translation initiation factor IF-2 [Desulfuromonas sp. DDH964]AMV72080.1 translation initiation factor IF-2 [Desulfuromonas sp. DDH964]